jgi:hypothetical protein
VPWLCSEWDQTLICDLYRRILETGFAVLDFYSAKARGSTPIFSVRLSSGTDVYERLDFVQGFHGPYRLFYRTQRGVVLDGFHARHDFFAFPAESELQAHFNRLIEPFLRGFFPTFLFYLFGKRHDYVLLAFGGSALKKRTP